MRLEQKWEVLTGNLGVQTCSGGGGCDRKWAGSDRKWGTQVGTWEFGLEIEWLDRKWGLLTKSGEL